MCVIFVAKDTRPTTDEIVKADRANPHGIGVAWLDTSRGFVRWVKGLTVAQAQHLAETMPLPFAMHFRWATVGAKGDALCHPFPLEQKVRLDKWGRTTQGVLMHNGHWHEWEKWVKQWGGKKFLKQGEWSDTRGIAWLAARAKNMDELLKKVSGKFAKITPQGIDTVGYFMQVRPGLTASNMSWDTSYRVWDYTRRGHHNFTNHPYSTWNNEEEDYYSEEGYAGWKKVQEEAEASAKQEQAAFEAWMRDAGVTEEELKKLDLLPPLAKKGVLAAALKAKDAKADKIIAEAVSGARGSEVMEPKKEEAKIEPSPWASRGAGPRCIDCKMPVASLEKYGHLAACKYFKAPETLATRMMNNHLRKTYGEGTFTPRNPEPGKIIPIGERMNPAIDENKESRSTSRILRSSDLLDSHFFRCGVHVGGACDCPRSQTQSGDAQIDPVTGQVNLPEFTGNGDTAEGMTQKAGQDPEKV